MDRKLKEHNDITKVQRADHSRFAKAAKSGRGKVGKAASRRPKR